jgi:hypothetical protein
MDPKAFGVGHDLVSRAMRSEGIPCGAGYQPMHRYELFQPHLSRLPVPSAFPERFRFEEMRFPDAERICDGEALWLGESVFRAGKQGIDDAVTALKKIYEHRAELVAKAQELKSE